MRFQHGERLCEAWTVRIAFNQSCFIVDGGVDAHAHAFDVHVDQLHLLAHVRHDFLRRVRWRGCAQIGNQIKQRPIILMADRGNQRRMGGCRGAYHAFVGESDQIFESAADTGHDDHVDIRIGIHLRDRLDHVGRALLTLHMHMRHFEIDNRPTQSHVGDDIAFGASLRRANQTNAMRKLGQRLLAVSVEQAFAFQLLA